MDEGVIAEKMKLLSEQINVRLTQGDKEKILKDIIALLNSSFRHTATYIYLYDEWQGSYEPVLEDARQSSRLTESAQRIVKFIDSIIRHPDLKRIYKKRIGGLNFTMLPLKPAIGPEGILIMVHVNEEKSVSHDCLMMIKEELEQILTTLHHYHHLSEQNRKHELLCQFTSGVYSTQNKEEILKRIITSIRTFYPTFTYSLLLSHDFHLSEPLPVSTLEYSRNNDNEASYRAFISGQLEAETKKDQTSIYLPLVGTQGVYGVIHMVSSSIIFVPDYEKEFMMKFAQAAGKAVENATLIHNSKRLVSDLQMINEATRQLNSNLHKEEILTLVKDKINAMFGVNEIGFIISKGNSRIGMDILEESTDYFKTGKGKALSKYLWEKNKNKREATVMWNFNEDDDAGYHSITMIPMQQGIEHLGIVIILHNEQSYLTFDRFKLVQSLIQQSTISLLNCMLREELEQAVITDYLTTLYSRSFLDKKIGQHLEWDDSGVLILFDIDDFKNINDLYGHYIGDEVIIQVANLIKQNITDKDIAARWGGEELAVYLPNRSIEQGYGIAKRISRQVEVLTDPEITISARVSAWSSEKPDSVKALFIGADQALYEAKNIGKNRVIKKT